MGQQLMLHTVQEIVDVLTKQQLKMTQQQEMMNGVTQIDDEILGTFRDREELRRLNSALTRGGPQKAPICQPYTKVPPYILCFLRHKCF